MQVSPLVQHLQRPVRFVPDDSAQPLSLRYFYQYRPVSGSGLGLGIQNRLANFAQPAGCADVREIGSEMTTLAQNRVTSGATVFAKEDRLAGGRVARNRYADSRRIQAADKCRQLPDLIVGQGECGHRRALHAILDEPEKVAVLGAADFPTGDQIRTLPFALSALAVSRVAARTKLKVPPLASLHGGGILQ